MRVVVTGGTGVLGRAAVPALIGAGHEVAVVCRRPGNVDVVEQMGALPAEADIFDVDSLAAAYAGADVAVNLATHVPVGYRGMLERSWRSHDQLHARGSATVVEAARSAGVRRVIQESVTSVYADQGDDWINESSPVMITRAVDPTAVAEAHVQGFTCGSRAGVVLRFGQVMGDDPITRYWLRAAAHRRPVGIGRPDAWTHLIHTDDIGSAVVAALVAPAGTYNVGAAPVRKSELVAAFAERAGVDEVGFLGPVLRRVAGHRLEPVSRSLRVCSEHFSAQTGWRPQRERVDAGWLSSVALETVSS